MIRSRFFKLVMLTLLPFFGAILFFGQSAGALPNQGPNPDDFVQSGRYGNDYVNQPRYVDFVVATSAYNAIPTTKVKIYMPTPSGAIVVNNKNICYSTFRNGGRNFDLPDDGNLNGASGNPVNYSIPGASNTPQQGGWDSSATCDSKSITFNVSGASIDPNTGMYLYVLTATANASAAKYMNTFWVVAPTGSIVSNDSTLSTSGFGMNQTSPIADNNNPSSDAPPPPSPFRNFTNYNIKFAPDCTVTTPTVSKTIQIFDDDNNSVSATDNWAVQPGRFRVGLKELVRGSAPGSPGTMLTPTNISTPGGSVSMGGGFYEVFTSGSNKTSTLTYTFRKDRVYEWILDSVYQDNTLQFKIPFDNVYYYQQCQTAGYNLQPNVVPSASSVEVGDTLSFNYNVNNTGSTDSASVGCDIYGKAFGGYHASSSGAELAATGYTPPDASYSAPSASCPQSFPNGVNTGVATESFTVTAAMANKTLCRALYVDSGVPGGSPAGDEACVPVIVKPYSRVYGGDVVAGGGLMTAPNTCTTNTGAAIIGWNRRGAPNNYGGAGVQFAAYALSTIFDTATSLGNGGGGAAAPIGLSFANTATNATSGQFGGSFGAVPCIPDHYAKKPATTSSMPASVGVAASGSYSGTGNFQLGGGTVTAGSDVSIFVDGDVFISSNITYGGSGSWTNADIPMFRLVARGNIYISNAVSQLDGLYVAQPNGSSGGIIYTCAVSGTPFTPLTLNATLASQCDNNKLTVNGSFVARQVQLLRTVGTLRQGNGTEASNSANIGEVFNYNPALWISQPSDNASEGVYDAINSLPPVL
jgi:hypothetical protein